MATQYFIAWQTREEVYRKSSTLALVTAYCTQYKKCSVYKKVYSEYIIPMHLAQINRWVSLQSGTL